MASDNDIWSQHVIITIIHLLILFISSFTDAPYASLFVIVYTYAYSTQSPNIALLSCLLRTLGIVIHLHAQYTSCLLRTLAVWSLATVARNLAVSYSFLIRTCLLTEYVCGFTRYLPSLQKIRGAIASPKYLYSQSGVYFGFSNHIPLTKLAGKIGTDDPSTTHRSY